MHGQNHINFIECFREAACTLESLFIHNCCHFSNKLFVIFYSYSKKFSLSLFLILCNMDFKPIILHSTIKKTIIKILIEQLFLQVPITIAMLTFIINNNNNNNNNNLQFILKVLILCVKLFTILIFTIKTVKYRDHILQFQLHFKNKTERG